MININDLYVMRQRLQVTIEVLEQLYPEYTLGVEEGEIQAQTPPQEPKPNEWFSMAPETPHEAIAVEEPPQYPVADVEAALQSPSGYPIKIKERVRPQRPLTAVIGPSANSGALEAVIREEVKALPGTREDLINRTLARVPGALRKDVKESLTRLIADGILNVDHNGAVRL